MGNEGDNNKWQDTLYIWDGIVTVDDKTAAGDKKMSDISVSWEGTWVPVDDCPDASKAAAPKRNAFAEYIDSDFIFSVSGTASTLNESEEERLFVANFSEGDGWDMEQSGKKEKHTDKEHEVLVKSLRWSGNMYDQTENLIVAKGTNEFGPFVSVGWMRPGNRWTLARRYLSDENDPRVKWTLQELQDAIVKEAVELVEDSGQKKLTIPPWQNAVLHSDYQEATKRGEKRKHGEDDGGETTGQ
ncbi:hypothetical protein IV203_024220 [Nitzschia inconspicua]|uniref:Uncharacterized protein n=1 Tax=Nitzschia inconspicua TaxID=303405 RepID=A0A9K3PAR3_9STRA|nr:hypothetical protein IV203_024220 [Nitzschia inconspicua]